MENAVENVLYFVSPDGDLEAAVDAADAAEFVSENPQSAFAYIEDNKLETTHKVFQVSTTTNLLSIWTGDK